MRACNQKSEIINQKPQGVYPRGAVGRHYDHRHLDCVVAAGGAICEGGGPADPVRQQSQTVGPGDGGLRERQPSIRSASSTGRRGPARSVRCRATPAARTASTADRHSSFPSGLIWSRRASSSGTTSTTRSTRTRTARRPISPCRSTPVPATGKEWSPSHPRSRGNYVTNWGYCDFLQTQPTGFKIGPFSANRQSTAASIRDGLSNTMFMGEVIQAISDDASYCYDLRGDFFNNDSGASEFMTYSTPNSGVDSSVLLAGADAQRPRPLPVGRTGVHVGPQQTPRRRQRPLRRRLRHFRFQFHAT